MGRAELRAPPLLCPLQASPEVTCKGRPFILQSAEWPLTSSSVLTSPMVLTKAHLSEFFHCPQCLGYTCVLSGEL
jgi:hypothetical protein